jgi:hypothetical protein
MENCYLCNVNLPKGEGKRMLCFHSFSFGIFLLYTFGLFTGGIISYLLKRKNSTLETVCDNCFAANQAYVMKELLVLFILMMLLVIICLTVRL